MKTHEFYLDESQRTGDARRYRIALGNLIDTQKRIACPTHEFNEEGGFKTGSIGFMDVRSLSIDIPKKDVPIKNLDYKNREIRNAIVIEMIGIEPEYTRKGHGTFLMKRAEEIARERGLNVLVASFVNESKDRHIVNHMFTKAGYQFYDSNAFKRLE